MLLTKNGITYDLTSQTQIEAFRGCGWIEALNEKHRLNALIKEANKQLEEAADEHAPKAAARKSVKK